MITTHLARTIQACQPACSDIVELLLHGGSNLEAACGIHVDPILSIHFLPIKT